MNKQPGPGAASGRPPDYDLLSVPELLERAQKGDGGAFTAFVKRTEQKLFWIFLRITQDEHLAQDFTQEVFLKAWKHLQKLRPNTALSWLVQIVRNLSIDQYRRWGERRRASIDSCGSDDSKGSPFEPIDPQPGPHERLEFEELRERIAAVLMQLSGEELQLLDDKYGLTGEAMTAADIAAKNGTSAGSVQMKLQRIRDDLRKNLPMDDAGHK